MEELGSSFQDLLVPILEAGDATAGWEALVSLEGEELTEAREWFGSNARWFRDLQHVSFVDPSGRRTVATHTRKLNAEWMVDLCALRLCGPVTAARRVNWRARWDHMADEGEAHFVQWLWDADPAWVQAFVNEASSISLGSERNHAGEPLSRVLRAVLAHHGLPAPDGSTFYAHAVTGAPLRFLDRTARNPLLDFETWFRTDPLMPKLPHGLIASGESGGYSWLPDAVLIGLQIGALDRVQLLETLFDGLSSPQRASSQKVIVQCLAACDLKPSEIPGGLTFLLGVMDVSTPYAVKAALPWALELVSGTSELDELSRLVAARPERGLKAMLLDALGSEGLSARVPEAAVDDALRLLAEESDASFAAKVSKVMSRRGTMHGSSAPTPARLGLWDLEPTVSGVDHNQLMPWFRGDPPRWSRTFDKRTTNDERVVAWANDEVLRSMSADPVWADTAMADFRKVLSTGRLSTSRLTGAFTDLFMSGGLRLALPLALDLLEECLTTGQRPANLHLCSPY